MKKNLVKPKNNEEFDQYFEDNDISDLLDRKVKRINLDLPANVLHRLDAQAHLIGLTRQSLIKYWISEKLGLNR
ncbi:MAG: CopG family transcriptional regulator [Candidatus Margulisiibacteriota bacterium]